MIRPKVLIVIGTRPEVVKMAPLVKVFRACPRLRTTVLGTAQHRGLMDQMLATFDIKLDHDLDLMHPNQTSEQIVEAIFHKLPPVLKAERPDLVLVQGDTTTALGAALCAFYQQIPVGHVEAGLRSHDPAKPFPEEINRVLIDRMAALLFAPTRDNRDNLTAEGISPKKIPVTGNTVIDAVHWLLKQPAAKLPQDVAKFLAASEDRPKVLMTVHRRESFGAPIRDIFKAVNLLLKIKPELRFIYPVHPNPQVRLPAQKALKDSRILLTGPMDYTTFIHTARRCDLILSDSGGVQEESPSLGVPLVILRDVTERPEVLKTKRAVLAGTETASVVRHSLRLLKAGKAPKRGVRNPFGDGRASENILKAVLRYLG